MILKVGLFCKTVSSLLIWKSMMRLVYLPSPDALCIHDRDAYSCLYAHIESFHCNIFEPYEVIIIESILFF